MNMEVKIERMAESHIAQVAKIEEECFSEPWSYNGLFAELNNPNAYFIVATSAKTVIGYAGMYCISGDCFVTNIAVSSKYRGIGIGKILLQSLIDYAQGQNFNFISLEVRASNEIAKNLYKSFGFSEVGRRKNFYTKPSEDAILMTFYLS